MGNVRHGAIQIARGPNPAMGIKVHNLRAVPIPLGSIVIVDNDTTSVTADHTRLHVFCTNAAASVADKKIIGVVVGHAIDAYGTGVAGFWGHCQSLLGYGAISRGDWLVLSGFYKGTAATTSTVAGRAFAFAKTAKTGDPGTPSFIQAFLVPWRI